ncbi:heavy-metal-associated domain-containing protein [Clostridium thermobutyricum]|uniref:heavy-metal-associated domain-containing protein n=1 Tax=Clostridium thermobutyricum TaxID=29372 RepID=UPI0018ABC991|nr:heavy-metal-associated domain-containing protein [Clostridium thermobutyricum]
MKAVLKIVGINNSTDVRKAQQAISSNTGVIASEISVSKKEVTIIYNESYVKLDSIIDSIEALGYIII